MDNEQLTKQQIQVQEDFSERVGQIIKVRVEAFKEKEGMENALIVMTAVMLYQNAAAIAFEHGSGPQLDEANDLTEYIVNNAVNLARVDAKKIEQEAFSILADIDALQDSFEAEMQSAAGELN